MNTSRWMALPLPLLGALLSLSAQAQSKTYKCIIDGRTVFQQSACPVTAEPEVVNTVAKPAAAASSVRVVLPAAAKSSAAPQVAASTAAAASAVSAVSAKR